MVCCYVAAPGIGKDGGADHRGFLVNPTIRLELAWAWTCPHCEERNVFDPQGKQWAPTNVGCIACRRWFAVANVDASKVEG